ncbi:MULTISPECIES: alpha/beta hydrolase [Burkholderiaceae]|nr:MULTISPECIES: alpha/beta fold hydrolase [Burkholderiaceae]
MIQSDTSNVRLFVRNKRRDDVKHFPSQKILLFVSGSTYPASTSFDLRLDGVSWMDQLAAKGYDTYLVDVRGYGRSDCPAEMSQPAEQNPPAVRTSIAVRDVGAAVAYVQARTGAMRINLIGWSWGSTLMASYTAENNDRVHKLTLLAPQWLREGPSMADSGGPLGAYRVVQRTAARARWLNGVPEHARGTLLPTAWFNTWADATFTEPTPGDTNGATQLRAPNGTVLDSREYWAAGKALYNPAEIRVPVLIVHADWDRDCPIEMSRTVFSKLTNAPYRRWVEIGEGTHSVLMEKNRWQVFAAVQAFLDEQAPV